MSRKKKLIYGFVIFMLLMLCFYLIARGIYANNLAMVDVRSPEAIPLTHSVIAVGNVSSGSEKAVFVPGNLPISRVQVRVGDQVKEGDVLFTCDVDVLLEAIEEEQLEEYRALLENNGQVTAKQDGLITSVNIQAGGWTSSLGAFLLADTENPFIFEAHISKEQKQYVSQGMQALVALEGNRSFKGKVDYLTESGLGDGSFDVTVNLEEGMGNPGESGTLRTSLQTQVYGCCIPLEALHKDSNQRNYVYVLEEREGILGTELSVRQQFVEVLDQNDSYAALQPGVFDTDTKVITYSTKEISEGAIVRMRD